MLAAIAIILVSFFLKPSLIYPYWLKRRTAIGRIPGFPCPRGDTAEFRRFLSDILAAIALFDQGDFA
jgi:hypothetical protein